MSRKTAKEPLRILKTPDPIFWQAGFDEERPTPAALDSLERGRRPAPTTSPERPPESPKPAPARPESGAPPARERVFTRELRNVTGNVLQHRPSAEVRPIRREARRPLDPPSREEEPPVETPAAQDRTSSHPLRRLRHSDGEFTPPKSLPPGADRPWLRSISEKATERAESQPVGKISPAPPLVEEPPEAPPEAPPETGAARAEISPPPPLHTEPKPEAPPEVVLLESDDLVALPEHVRGAARVLQTVIVASGSFVEQAPPRAPVVTPVVETEAPKAEFQLRPSPEVKADAVPQARAGAPAQESKAETQTPEAEAAAPAVPATVMVEVDHTPVPEPVVEGPPEIEAVTVVEAAPVETDDEEDTSELLDDPDLDAVPVHVAPAPGPAVVAVPAAPEVMRPAPVQPEPEAKSEPEAESEPVPAKDSIEAELPDESPSLKDEFFHEILEDEPGEDLDTMVSDSAGARSAGPATTPVAKPVPAPRPRDESDPFDVADDDPIFLNPLDDDLDAPAPSVAKNDAPDMDEFLEVDSGLDLELGLDHKIDEHIRESLHTETAQAVATKSDGPEPAPGDEEAEILLDDSELADHVLPDDEPASAQAEVLASPPAEREPHAESQPEPPQQAAQPPVTKVPEAKPAPVVAPSGEPRITDELLSESDSPLPDNTTVTLQKLYTKRRIEATDFQEILNLILEKSRADALAFLLLDSMQMVFRTLVSCGMDEASERNLYIGIDDQYIGSENHFQTIRFKSDAMREDFHFKKRFSTDFFERMDGLYIINLHPSGLPGYLVLAYDDLNRLAANVLEITLPPIMRDVLPVLNRYRTIAWEPELRSNVDSSIVDEIYKLLKHVSRSGRDELCVIHLRFPGLLQQSAWRTRLARIAESLSTAIGPGEKLIRATPERLILILKETSPDSVVGAARESAGNWGQGLSHRILRYPQFGRNFYNYIAPGL